MIVLTILSLVSGLVYGYFDVESSFISAITQNTHIVLYILMFSVGTSIGMYDGIVQKIREYHIRFYYSDRNYYKLSFGRNNLFYDR